MTSTWCTNHQHLIRSPHRCRVHLLLLQSSHAEYLGLSVLSAASVQPVVDCTTEQLLAEAGPERARQLVCEFVAEAGCRYLVVPHSVRARASGICRRIELDASCLCVARGGGNFFAIRRARELCVCN